MAVNETLIATWSGGSAYSRTEAYESGRNDAAGWVDAYWWVGSRDTHASVSGTWDFTRYGGPGSSSGSVSAATGTRGIQSGTHRLYCDANGNYAGFGIGLYLNVFFGAGDSTTNIGFSRSPLAPTISVNSSSAITPVAATLTGAVSNNGHGTSTTITYYYRVNGVGSYTNAGTGSSKNLTGLTPNTNYQWYITATNNNGDTATGSVQNFTTLSGIKMITSGGGTVNRVVKQILPSGVTTTRIVTKIT